MKGMNFNAQNLHLIHSGCRETTWFRCGRTMVVIAHSFPKPNHSLSKSGLLGAMFSLDVTETRKWLLRMLMMQTPPPKKKMGFVAVWGSTIKFARAIVWKLKSTVKKWRITSPTRKMLLRNLIIHFPQHLANCNSTFGHQRAARSQRLPAGGRRSPQGKHWQSRNFIYINHPW